MILFTAYFHIFFNFDLFKNIKQYYVNLCYHSHKCFFLFCLFPLGLLFFYPPLLVRTAYMKCLLTL